MNVREFFQHLILNGELEDKVTMEVKVGEQFVHIVPKHVCRIDDGEGHTETIIECVECEEDGRL